MNEYKIRITFDCWVMTTNREAAEKFCTELGQSIECGDVSLDSFIREADPDGDFERLEFAGATEV